MFSVFIYFVIEILYCDNTDFQMTYRHNTVSGGVHYMVLGETLAFHLRAEYRAWGSIHHNYSWFSMRWPSLCVMTWLSCLNHLRNRTVCLDEIQVPYFEFLAVKSFFCYCLSRSFMELNYSHIQSGCTISYYLPQNILGDLMKWNMFINTDIVMLVTCMCFSLVMCLNTHSILEP